MSTPKATSSRLIVALDFPSVKAALEFVAPLEASLCRLKVGKELFTRGGPEILTALHARGFEVFLDLKFHDIPNTVAAACRAAADLGVWMLNVHALGGRAMLEAAREALEASSPRPLLVAVTVLTSHSEKSLREVGISQPMNQQVLQLATLAHDAGLDGIVCSGEDLATMTAAMTKPFLYVTPGIRLQVNDRQDQQRVVTPEDAIRLGSDYLVLGRPITQAAHPLEVINMLNQRLGTAQG